MAVDYANAVDTCVLCEDIYSFLVICGSHSFIVDYAYQSIKKDRSLVILQVWLMSKINN